jgi:hypothetical protein
MLQAGQLIKSEFSQWSEVNCSVSDLIGWLVGELASGKTAVVHLLGAVAVRSW